MYYDPSLCGIEAKVGSLESAKEAISSHIFFQKPETEGEKWIENEEGIDPATDFCTFR
jgi:hypothetical protein